MSGFTAAGVLSSAGSAVTDLLSSQGSQAEADAFGQAAQLAGQNAFIAQSSGQITSMQAIRQITQTIGTQKADVAANGMTESGSSLDLLADSQRQGQLTLGLIGAQTGINVNSYTEQQDAYTGEQKAAEAAASSGQIGGVLQGAGALAGLGMLLFG